MSDPPAPVAAILAAAGSGERLGPGPPKALRLLAGLPMLLHAARALAQAESVTCVVVVAPSADVVGVRDLLIAAELPARVDVVAGGATRPESVRRALHVLPDDTEVVLVHDAARPLAPVALVEAVVSAVRQGAPAVVPALPIGDTVKRVGAGGAVLETLDRAALRAVQTPQGFRRGVLEDAYAGWAAVPDDVTDDAGLVERCGVEVRTIPGADAGFKITRPVDLVFAEALLAGPSGVR